MAWHSVAANLVLDQPELHVSGGSRGLEELQCHDMDEAALERVVVGIVHHDGPSDAEPAGAKVDEAAFRHEPTQVASVVVEDPAGKRVLPPVADGRRGLVHVDGQESAALEAVAEAEAVEVRDKDAAAAEGQLPVAVLAPGLGTAGRVEGVGAPVLGRDPEARAGGQVGRELARGQVGAHAAEIGRGLGERAPFLGEAGGADLAGGLLRLGEHTVMALERVDPAPYRDDVAAAHLVVLQLQPRRGHQAGPRVVGDGTPLAAHAHHRGAADGEGEVDAFHLANQLGDLSRGAWECTHLHLPLPLRTWTAL